MIKLKQAHNDSGSGLGYQISCYVMMRALEKRTGLQWGVDSKQLLALRHTFKDLKLNVIESIDDKCKDMKTEYKTVAFDDEDGFEHIANNITDNTIIDTYPTPYNFVPVGDNGDLFLECKRELVFRDDINTKCKDFIKQFGGHDVICMHVRRGDFKNPENGMFVCGTDYYENALALLPNDLPVLIFTNDKDSVIQDTSLIASNPSRFTFITDLYNDNELIDCDLGQELDRRVDYSGANLFDYRSALSKIVREDSVVLNKEQLIMAMSQKLKELHPKYTSKIKTNSYNHSFDLCLMTMCRYFIMANSSYSVWASELGAPDSSKTSVIYPMYWLQGHVGTETAMQPIKSDLGDFNQTEYLARSLVDRPHYQPLPNPDPRAFEVI